MNRTILCAALLGALALHSRPAVAETYVADPKESRLAFAFIQAGAENSGRFDSFDVELSLDDARPEAGRLEVSVRTASVNTRDEERDEILRSAELFDVANHPRATFSSTDIKRTAAGRYEARGTLTIRGVAREVRVPFALADGRMTGGALLKRLDYGVGRGEWESTEWVGNQVKITFDLRLVPKVTRASRRGE